jgi:hypothetical protein
MCIGNNRTSPYMEDMTSTASRWMEVLVLEGSLSNLRDAEVSVGSRTPARGGLIDGFD